MRNKRRKGKAREREEQKEQGKAMESIEMDKEEDVLGFFLLQPF